MTTQDVRDKAHIEALANELGAHLIYDATNTGGNDGPRAQIELREVHLRPSVVDYWAALHELGHIATTELDARKIAYQYGLLGVQTVIDEARAWQWALDNANRPPDAAAKADIAISMASYFYSHATIPVADPTVAHLIRLVGPNPAIDENLDEYSRPYRDVAHDIWTRANALAGAV